MSISAPTGKMYCRKKFKKTQTYKELLTTVYVKGESEGDINSHMCN
jgi:hypothetical protein